MKQIMILLLALGLATFGCCGLTSQQEQDKISFDSTQVVDKNINLLVLTNEDLYERSESLGELDSWGNYPYELHTSDIRISEDNTSKTAPQSIKMGTGETVQIIIIQTTTVNLAENKFLEMKNDLAEQDFSERVSNQVNVGNEMITAEKQVSMMSANLWKYTILFRRNNVIVEISVSDALEIPPYSEKNDFMRDVNDYALMIDKKVTS